MHIRSFISGVLFLGMTGTLASGNAYAIDYRSVAVPAILYEGPSSESPKKFIISPMTPLEIVVSTEKWIKVRDASGTLTWIEPKALTSKRTVIVTANSASLKAQAQDSASTLQEVPKDSVFELVNPTPTNGWVQIRLSGKTAYIRLTDIWGM